MMIRRTVGRRASRVAASACLAAVLAAPVAAQDDSRPLARALTKAPFVSADRDRVPPDEPQTPAAADNPVLKFFSGTEVAGFVDTYYAYNLNTPAKACATVGGVAVFNCLHNFDVAHNAFSLNLAEILFEKKPTTDSRGGYRLDLNYGAAAAIVAGFDPSATSINQNVQHFACQQHALHAGDHLCPRKRPPFFRERSGQKIGNPVDEPRHEGS